MIAHISRRPGEGQARLVCGGASKGRSDCGFTGAPLELIEKSFLSLMANCYLIRRLLANKDNRPNKLNLLEMRLAETEGQVEKLSRLICDDRDPSPAIYCRLKLEERKANELKAEVERERMRQRSEKPALTVYAEFCAGLPALVQDPARRSDLRRCIAGLLEKVVLDPHGNGNGIWGYEVHLKGAAEPVSVICQAKPEQQWWFRT